MDDEVRRELEDMRRDMNKMKARMNEKEEENEKLRRQVRELKINPVKRTFIDEEDERESTQWKEKAHNLLSLLDQLQRDMQNDLRELENETFSPANSRFSRDNSRFESSPVTAALPADRKGSPFSAGEVTPIRDAGLSRRREEASIVPSYDHLLSSAKHVHTVYRVLKEATANTPKDKVWKPIASCIKITAKTARDCHAAVVTDQVAVGSDKFAQTNGDLARHGLTWVDAVKAHGGSRMSSSAEELRDGIKEFQDSARALQNSNSSDNIRRHSRATQTMGDAMKKNIDKLQSILLET